MKKYESIHLVKGEDLNHHGTLFAARAAAWLVEAGFAAASCEQGDPSEIVCRNLHSMSFAHPVKKGSLLQVGSRVAAVGKTSITVCVWADDAISGETAVEGFITFVAVCRKTGVKKEHQIVLDEPADERERLQRERCSDLKKV